jgi:hypothetical protein
MKEDGMGGAYSKHPEPLSAILLANRRLTMVVKLKSYIVSSVNVER